ncbi:FBRL [Hepatospora eriocheir]|uniref:rRNA 2'-O-methyltransferase fibrillarin n=2 Tax=Hepatospora eriocheir TaxID=1081669 RepID=A0A1X0QL01_9MICR|nr:FBRL [Hepatospora eriocheir]
MKRKPVNNFSNKNNQKFPKKRPYTGDKNISKKMKTVLVQPHPKFKDIYVGRNKEDVLLTKNMNPGVSVYNEKRVSVKSGQEIIEYRTWNCYRSKLAAGIVSGLDNIYIKKGTTVLYLGAANGTTVSHVSDIVGEESLLYSVEFSKRTGSDLISLAMTRKNIVPIIADARRPQDYRMIVPMVDVIFSDVSQPDQTKIVMDNARYFLKDGGKILISIKASSVDSSVPAEKVFTNEVNWLRKHDFKPKELVTIEPFEKNHAIITGSYKPTNKTSYQ